MLTYCVLWVASLAILTDNKASWRAWHKNLKANMLFERLHLNRLKLWWPGDAWWVEGKFCVHPYVQLYTSSPIIRAVWSVHQGVHVVSLDKLSSCHCNSKDAHLEDKHFDCLRGSKTSNTSYCTSVLRSLYSYFPSAQVRDILTMRSSPLTEVLLSKVLTKH